MSNAALIITYGETKLDFNALPESSLVAMLRRGVSHYLGSEQASKVTGLFKLADDGTMRSELPDTEDNRAMALEEFRLKALDALSAGTVGVSVRGPSVDPLTVHAHRIARKEVTDILKANGVKPPKKAEDVVETPDGSKFTMAQLVERRVNHATHAERINREAKKALDEQKKKAAKAEESAKAEGLSGL